MEKQHCPKCKCLQNVDKIHERTYYRMNLIERIFKCLKCGNKWLDLVKIQAELFKNP